MSHVGYAHAADLLRPPPVPAGGHPARGLVVRPLHVSYRDVDDLLAERGLDVSYETVRRWVLKFGTAIARRLRRRRPKPSSRWHLDKLVARIAGKQTYLWRAVDDEGKVLDVLVQRRRDKAAACELMRKLLRKQGFAPTVVTTDKLRSCGAAFTGVGLAARHEQGFRRDCQLDALWSG